MGAVWVDRDGWTRMLDDNGCAWRWDPVANNGCPKWVRDWSRDMPQESPR